MRCEVEARKLKPHLKEVKIDDSAGSVQDQSQTEAEDGAVPQQFIRADTADIEIMAHGEIEYPQQESFLPHQSAISQC